MRGGTEQIEIGGFGGWGQNSFGFRAVLRRVGQSR